MSSSRHWLVSGATLVALIMAGVASAAPVMDGTASPSDGYGAALSIQNTQTQFGDNDLGDLVATRNGGSEINQVFGTVADGRLYVTITGNLERNFNKLEVFVDVDGASGGVNEIVGNQVPAAVDAFCCGGFGTTDGALQRQDFLTFDSGFYADYYLTFSHGGESIGGQGFWGISAHYADLTDGTAGRVVRAGYQLAPLGNPAVLRGPLQADFNNSGTVDGQDFLIWQRGFGVGNTKPQGDANEDGFVDGVDLGIWQNQYATDASLSDPPYAPTFDSLPTTSLAKPTLPGLGAGQLIDKNYALGAGGCTADGTDGGAGCIAPELQFALPVDSDDPTNTKNHRDFDNTIDLEMGFNNSNVAGVEGGSGAVVTGDPQNVITGLEFSIPLDQILNYLNATPAGDIRFVAFINGTAHDFVANQFSGVGSLGGNFGSLPPNMETEIAGIQYVTVNQSLSAIAAVPEPSTVVLLSLVAAGCLCGRKNR